jgi:hypothetical protein
MWLIDTHGGLGGSDAAAGTRLSFRGFDRGNLIAAALDKIADKLQRDGWASFLH